MHPEQSYENDSLCEIDLDQKEGGAQKYHFQTKIEES